MWVLVGFLREHSLGQGLECTEFIWEGMKEARMRELGRLRKWRREKQGNILYWTGAAVNNGGTVFPEDLWELWRCHLRIFPSNNGSWCIHPLLPPLCISWGLQLGTLHSTTPPPAPTKSGQNYLPKLWGKLWGRKNWAILLGLEVGIREISTTVTSKIKGWREYGWGNPAASTKPFSCQK